MDKPLTPHIDDPLGHLHFRTVSPGRPLHWLARGLDDMRDNLPASLAYGLFFAVLGYVLLAFASDRPYLFTAAVSGFFLIGPVAAAGLYEISRRHENGERCGLAASLRGLFARGDTLLYFGLFLAIAMVSWERLSAILFALFYHGNVPDLGAFYSDLFLSGDYMHFVVAYLFVGGIIATLLFCLSAISLPLMLDRDTDIVTAMMASMKAVGHNLGAMIVWAGLIVALVAIGMATWMVGLVFTLPLLGHATWAAYRDLVARD